MIGVPACLAAGRSSSAGSEGGRERSGHNARRTRSTRAGRWSLSAAISTAFLGLLREYTGRGPTRARTTIRADTIVVTLRDSLTKAERTLAARGQATEVLAMRRAFQNTMRDDFIAAVQELTGRSVEAFLSDNLHDPDVAVEIFLMAPSDNNGAGAMR
ncbi:MAG: DUF2294 domain-containing protein [Solirubrobacteraceae bacterium MAG38_C4-C5]|nr:DUF2294 domain-containing protein [Candidatus Siliceabacter maunaloa]